MKNQENFIVRFTNWVETQNDIDGAILVGSYAHGTARADSDLDLVIITNHPNKYLEQNDWINELGNVTTVKDEDFGMVQVKRVFFEDGLEVEFGFTTPEWLNVNPIDPGTQRVLADGYKIFNDKAAVFAAIKTIIKPL